ncbi:MAG: family 43 glycosylhydrolase [Bacteroidales bacterium]|nr:family 43 glycosylhydrolase [Bacteroidales bacterium]
MNRSTVIMILLISLGSCSHENGQQDMQLTTQCNPVDISYRFSLETPSRREAADPTVVKYKELFFLFASKSGGYWYSRDLVQWTFKETTEIPTEEYAPTAVVIGDTIYFLASSNEKSTIYKSTNPLGGEWSVAVEELETPVWDPAFFLDDDNRLFLYWGCSNVNPIYGVEVDYRNNFAFMGEPAELIHGNPGENGWEVPGDYNSFIGNRPWIEGAWMTRRDGRYYLQYAGPGTEFKSYSDGLYVSDNPLGPFHQQLHNPYALKPEGFAAGAGHGSSFSDDHGNLWHIGTITISQKHIFERRLGLYPVFYDKNKTMYTITRYGDYPLIIPRGKINGFEDIFPGWMLLSYNKKAEVSSSVDSLPPSGMTDENIRTYWAAESGSDREFAIIDLGSSCMVYAIQVNFAEHNTEIFGRTKDLYHRYKIWYSTDGTKWNILIDNSENKTDNTHIYKQLENPINCRYLKINNVEVPGGQFAISGFRVFGKGSGALPGMVTDFRAVRDQDDRRRVNLTWRKVSDATGYNISYGTDKEKLYHDHMVYNDTILTINSLNINQEYWFSIEAFNENGITACRKIIKAE